jgi:signal-transduction protein with cAMP-binding, CBS, and nucleotidyltransferase domain
MTRPSSDGISAGSAVGELTRPTTRVEAEAHLAAAAYLLHRSGDSALVVTLDGAGDAVALLTATDVSRAVAEGRDLESTRVRQVVTRPPQVVEADLPAREAARSTLSHGVVQLVIRGGDQVLGIADLADVCREVLAPESVAVLQRRPAAGPPVP